MYLDYLLPFYYFMVLEYSIISLFVLTQSNLENCISVMTFSSFRQFVVYFSNSYFVTDNKVKVISLVTTEVLVVTSQYKNVNMLLGYKAFILEYNELLQNWLLEFINI